MKSPFGALYGFGETRKKKYTGKKRYIYFQNDDHFLFALITANYCAISLVHRFRLFVSFLASLLRRFRVNSDWSHVFCLFMFTCTNGRMFRYIFSAFVAFTTEWKKMRNIRVFRFNCKELNACSAVVDGTDGVTDGLASIRSASQRIIYFCACAISFNSI